MTRCSLISTIVFTAVLAAVFTMGLSATLHPKNAKAEPEDETFQIAVVDLEYLARVSPSFQKFRSKWEEAQDHVQTSAAKTQRELNILRGKLRRAEIEKRNENELLSLRVELRALEEYAAASEEDHAAYLSALLSQYQSVVFAEAWQAVRVYVAGKGYDLVVQDTYLSPGDSETMEPADFNTTLLSKPFLDVPGSMNGENAFVTDITDEVIEFMSED